MTGAGSSDLNTMLRGLLLLWGEAAKYTALRASYKWHTSSVSEVIKTGSQNRNLFHPSQDSTSSDQVSKSAVKKSTSSFVSPSEVAARLGVVATGISSYLRVHSPAVSQSLSHGPGDNVAAAVQEINNFAAEAVSAVNTNLSPRIQMQQPQNVDTLDKGFALQMKSSQKPSGYDPIMDPSLTELDLETILGTKQKPASQFAPALDNFDLSANNTKLIDDLNVSHLLNDPEINRIAEETADAADGVRIKLDDTIQRTKEGIEQLPDAVSGFQVTHEQLDAIEEKLQSLRGAAFTHELNAIEDQASESSGDIESALNAAISSNKPATSAGTSSTIFHEVTKITNHSASENDVPQQATTAAPPSSPPAPAKKSPRVPKLLGRKPLAKDKPTSLLGASSRARAVPDTRLRRLISFGGLAAGLGAGTLAELTRRTLGGSGGAGKQEVGDSPLFDASPFLTEANANRIVDTLCKVRGAALKIGQMMSIQDNAFISPQLQQIFERVRQSADFMPDWQLQRIMSEELGHDWRDRFADFDTKPFAAASIGQVHEGVLADGRRVAVKVQYPGVAEGIDSDINNLMTTLNYASVVPEGMFVESVMKVAKRELAWECDYERERLCGERFAKLVEPFPQYYVPATIDGLCTKRVLTTELIDGVAVDKCAHMDQKTRNAICNDILELTLRELFQFGYMQTDPNWANFFYNESTQQVALVDFGACRSYSKSFVDTYIKIIHGAACRDRDAVVRYSQQLGFLTGHESKVMVEAHTDAVMILGETLQDDAPFSFEGQSTTQRIQRLMPTMVAHRMCPPPEEVYSLHRKMAGVYLLCARLQGVVHVQPLFMKIFRDYEYGGEWPAGPGDAASN